MKNMLEVVPGEGLEIIDDHVRRWGWEQSAFTDDVLSSKKWLPGAQPFTKNQHVGTGSGDVNLWAAVP